MGYRSTVCIGMNKNLYVRALILQTDFPKILRSVEPVFSDDKEYVYWRLEDIKWYEDYPDIQQAEAFFKANKDEIAAIRLGEDPEDVEHWGVPMLFGMGVIREIETPVQFR